MFKTYRAPLLFTAATIPFAAIGGIFTIIYSLSALEPATQQIMIDASGGYMVLLLSGTIQAVVITAICSFFGYILAVKTGLMKQFNFTKKPLLSTAIVTIIAGILFALDYWIFAPRIPELMDMYLVSTTPASFAASIFYGGVVEEILMRLFLMTLFAFLFWKIFARKHDKEHFPQSIFVIANIIAAAAFAAGHLPATIMSFGALTPVIIFRCFLYNGGLGVAFGALYQKYGIQYAMLAHAGVHIVSKIIWLLFI